MHVETVLKNVQFNIAAAMSTMSLALMEMFQFLDGILPTISLFLTTILTCVLIYTNLSTHFRKKRQDKDNNTPMV